MTLIAYLDASGSAIDPKVRVLSVSGFMARANDWAAFANEWQSILDRFKVTELHMRDYAHSRGEYAGWKGNEERRGAFLAELTAVIKKNTLQSVGVTMPVGLYRLFNRDYCIKETIGVPYTMAVMGAIATTVEWRDRSGIDESLQFFIEKGDNEQGDFRRFMSDRIKWEEDYIPLPTFMAKSSVDPDGRIRRVLPFQAADFIAYEHAKAWTDYMVHRKTQVRKSLQQVLKPIEDVPSGRTFWVLMLKSSFGKAMKNFKIPRRFTHAQQNQRVHPRWKAIPLGYIDLDHPVVGSIYGDGFIDEDPEEMGL